jgi:hypothetical protein
MQDHLKCQNVNNTKSNAKPKTCNTPSVGLDKTCDTILDVSTSRKAAQLI